MIGFARLGFGGRVDCLSVIVWGGFVSMFGIENALSNQSISQMTLFVKLSDTVASCFSLISSYFSSFIGLETRGLVRL